MIKNKKLTLYYFLLLVFPILFFVLHKIDQPKNTTTGLFQFYTSIKAPQLIRLDFYKNDKVLANWPGPFDSYKQIDFLDTKLAEDDKGFRLNIEHKSANDTLSFLGFNFLMDDVVYTLQPENIDNLSTSSNAKILIHNKQLKLVCLDQGTATLNINTPLSWSNNTLRGYKKKFTLGIFFIFLIAVVAFKPSRFWFLVSLCLSLGMTLYFWYLGKDASAQIIINSFSSQESATFYFNSTPVFSPELSVAFNDTNDIRRTQGYPGKYSFYRIDFQENIRNLAQTNIKYSIGVLNHTWELNKTDPFDINGNDIDYSHDSYYTSGKDPFLCLTTAEFSKTIKLIDLLRANIYLLFSLLTFVGTLIIGRLFKEDLLPQHIIIFPFLFICFGSLLLTLFEDRRLIMSEEKRLAFPAPTYTDSVQLKEYTRQLDNYLKDQLPGRGPLVIANNYIKYKVFSELATNPIVYFGKKDWMFYIGENVKEVYENKRLYTEEELKKMTRNLVERRDWLKEKGINYYILFPRLSHYFYKENVGEGIYQYIKKPRLEQFIEYLQKNSSVNLIDVYEPMLAAKRKFSRDLYYRSDSHWNLFGAYFAYEAVIKRIQKDYPQVKDAIPLGDIKWIETESDEADLSKLISLSGVITRHEFLPLHPDVNSSVKQAAPDYPEYHSVHPLIVYKGQDSLTPRLVMNRDSYSNFLIPYFSKHFSRQTYIWSPLFFPGIIEKEKPTIVITEMMERFLNDLLIDNPPLPLKTTTSAN